MQGSNVPGAFTALSGIKMDDKNCELDWFSLDEPLGLSHDCFCIVPSADSSFDYYMKLVPTVYEDLRGQKQYSYQYTFANKVWLAL